MHALRETPAAATLADPIGSARAAGLHHVSDDVRGIQRKPQGKRFRYFAPGGSLIKDEETLDRIRKVAIPPAWTDVWICIDARGHIQATGRDAKQRKQYRYHALWREVRDETKFEKVLEFARALPGIRRATSADLLRQGLPREKVLAVVVRLLEGTLIRVGNEEYARDNGSFGLTTMLVRHAHIHGESIAFRFRGKSGKQHSIGIRDRRLAKIVARCRDLPGHELFHYLDAEARPHTISSSDVNEYLHAITGHEFSAKDFRTWAGTVLATLELRELHAAAKTRAGTTRPLKKHVTSAIERVAERLGNTPSVCRKCYVHPAVIDAYLDGAVLETLRPRAGKKASRDLHTLHPEEAAVFAFLEKRLAQVATEGAPGGLTGKLSRSLFKVPARISSAGKARRNAA